MMQVSGISFIGLLFLAMLIALVWALATWRRRGRAARAFAVLGAVILVLFVGMMGLRQSVRVERTQVAREMHQMADAIRAAHGEARPERQRVVANTEGLEPDVYASARSAVVTSARGLLKDLIEVVPDGAEVHEVLVSGVADDVTRSDLVAAIAARLPAAEVRFEAVAESQPADASRVMLRVEPPMARVMDSAHPGVARSLKVILSGVGDERSRRPRVAAKEWVDDLDAFQRRHGRGQWIVVESPGLASSAAEALDAAQTAAAELLLPQVRAWAAWRPDFSPRLGDGASGRELIKVELNSSRSGSGVSGGMIRDSFVQRFDRRYGQVYRAALLMDTSEPQLQRLAGLYVSTFGAERTRLRQNVLSGAGLILVILLVYWFLSAATKGYYVWSVRLGCTMLLAAGVFTLIVLA